MSLTKHAQQQSQRRGISLALLEIVIDYGREYKCDDHAIMYRLNRNQLRSMENDFPKSLWRRYRDQISKVVPVVGVNQKVITAMHRFRRLKQK